jgi:actin-related protein 4
VIPTSYGYLAAEDKYLFGPNSVHTPLADVETRNPMSEDGTVEDWETAVKLWEYAITSRLTNTKPSKAATHGLNDPPSGENGENGETTDAAADAEEAAEGEKPLEESPLLMTEPGWNPTKIRETSAEIAFEQWGCPAFWLARNAVCAAFSGGKASALVIDVGATQLSITPVHDGLILKKGMIT